MPNRRIPSSWGAPGRELTRARGILASLIVMLALAISLAVPSAAFADDPVELRGADFVDTVGALAGREGEVQAALDQLSEDTGVQLFVVFVDRFDGISAGESWAIATSELNGLGTDDVLFAVATEDRNYDFRYPDGFRLDATATGTVEQNVISALTDNDWAGAAITAADGYREAISGNAVGQGAAGGSISWPLVLGGFLVILVILIVVVIIGVLRRRGAQAARRSTARLDQKQLDLRIGTLLVQLDNSVKTSEQELGFAIAEFGDDSTGPFVAALESAKAKLGQAFQIKQRLDDAMPETDEEKRAASLAIIKLCEEADKELDDQADAFDELRALEKSAPEALARLRADAERVSARMSAADASLASLRDRYSPAAISTVAENPAQAAKLLEFVNESGAEADSAIAAGKPGAAVAVQAARAAVGQATQLLDAIDTLSESLADASAKLDAEIADTRQDLAAAKAMPRDTAGLAPAIAAAEAAISAASDGPASKDPAGRLARITEANDELERILGAARDASVQTERARTALAGTIATARSQIGAANDFIATRRGGIGEVPRTRVAEASRHLDTAVSLSNSDPVAALAEAQRAADLAGSAVASAQSDVSAYQSGEWGGQYRGGQLGGGQYGGARSGGAEGADLGGLLVGMLLGGAMSGGSMGGRRGGGFGGLGGFGGGGGSFGGFGGSSRSGGFGGFGGGSRGSSGGFGGRSGSRSSRGRF